MSVTKALWMDGRDLCGRFSPLFVFGKYIIKLRLIRYNTFMILPVVKIPNKILLQKAKKVVKFDSKFLKLIKNMSDTLIASKNPEGVGLAAPQVGISIRLFVTRPTKRSKVR